MAVKTDRQSRLRFLRLLSLDGVEHWDFDELPVVPTMSDDRIHRTTAADRIDLLANQYYGSPVLWWVIALANDLDLIPTSFREGLELRIPSPSYVATLLFQKAKF